jgi:actin-related protein
MKQKEEEYAKSLGEVDEDDIHVATRKEEMHEEERKLRALEIDLREAQGDEAKKKIREKIEEQKHHIHEAKVKYETEKQRRILGSTFTKYRSKEDETKLTALETEAHVQEDKIKAQWKAYHAEKDETQKTTLRTEIEKMRAALKKNKDEHKALLTLQPERGYASVFENSTRLTAWTEGRLVAQNKEVGKEMRKIRADGLPKEKAGHDAHGGGGAHGGGHSGGNTHDKKEGHDGGEEDAHSEGQGKIVLDTNIKAAKQASAHPPKGGGGDHGHGGGGHQ